MPEPLARRLVLVRHGQTEWNATDRMQGQIDTELSGVGLAQAREVATALSGLRPIRILSSDLSRARDTAQAFVDAQPGDEVTAVRLDPRLRETNLGEWQGLDHRTVDKNYPGVRAAWRLNAALAPPGGESRIEVAARALPVVDELLDELGTQWQGSAVLIVAHGGLIAALTAALLDLPANRWLAFGGLGNTSWVQLAGSGERDDMMWRVEVWNAAVNAGIDGF